MRGLSSERGGRFSAGGAATERYGSVSAGGERRGLISAAAATFDGAKRSGAGLTRLASGLGFVTFRPLVGTAMTLAGGSVAREVAGASASRRGVTAAGPLKVGACTPAQATRFGGGPRTAFANGRRGEGPQRVASSSCAAPCARFRLKGGRGGAHGPKRGGARAPEAVNARGARQTRTRFGTLEGARRGKEGAAQSGIRGTPSAPGGGSPTRARGS